MAVLKLDGSPFDVTAHAGDDPLEDSPPTEADKMIVVSENFLAMEEAKERIALLKQTGHAVQFQLRTPKDLLRKTVVQPFQLDEAPPPIANLAQNFSTATGFDPSGIIVAATVAAAAVIDDRWRLEVSKRSDWYESARLWAVLIGNPSAGKSPCIRAATNPIKAMHHADVTLWERETRELKDTERPPQPALFTSDATVQALSNKLRGNPQGILMLTEEFSSWIGSIDATDKGEAASNRGQWLQLYDGGAFQIDRVQRGSFLVPNWSASVLAAGTPDGLRSHMKNMPEDGLIHRFIPVLLQSPNLDAHGDAREAIETWGNWLRWARAATSQSATTLNMSAEATVIFEAEHRAHRMLADASHEITASLASHIGKHGAMLARVALIFHVFSGHTPGTSIEPQTMQMAVRFMRRVRKHAHAMFDDVLGASPAWTVARALARSLAADEEATTTVSRDWMSSHCAAFKKADDKVRMEAVRILEDADWLEARIGPRANYGGWPRHWTVHERIPELFGREGEAWRARRALVREAIGENEVD